MSNPSHLFFRQGLILDEFIDSGYLVIRRVNNDLLGDAH